MAAIVPNAGELAALADILGVGGSNVTVHLYQNAYDPDASSVLGSFTEATFDGYAAINSSGWSGPTVDVTGVAYSVSPMFTWTMTGNTTPNLIYGWYATVVQGMATVVVAAERFATPGLMTGVGMVQTLQITARLGRAA